MTLALIALAVFILENCITEVASIARSNSVLIVLIVLIIPITLYALNFFRTLFQWKMLKSFVIELNNIYALVFISK